MFMGEYSPTLDEKGRVALPSRLRRAFGEDALINRLIITHGFDKCIMAFREPDWKDFVENRLIRLEQGDPKNRRRVRFLLGGSYESELDRQGRMMIPSYLKDYAGITKDLTILGLYNRIEIWAREIYEEYKPAGEELDLFSADLGF